MTAPETLMGLKPCPFCGGDAVWQNGSGSYGYYSPTIWIACENEPFDNPYRKKSDDRKHKCFARTKSLQTEEWETGKGTFDVTELACGKLKKLWNERA